MNHTFIPNLAQVMSGMLAVVLLAQGVSSGNSKEQKYRHSEIDIPMSLAVDTMRTPQFAVRHEAYFIMIQAQKGYIPFGDLKCKMGLLSGPLEKKTVPKNRCSRQTGQCGLKGK